MPYEWCWKTGHPADRNTSLVRRRKGEIFKTTNTRGYRASLFWPVHLLAPYSPSPYVLVSMSRPSWPNVSFIMSSLKEAATNKAASMMWWARLTGGEPPTPVVNNACHMSGAVCLSERWAVWADNRGGGASHSVSGRSSRTHPALTQHFPLRKDSGEERPEDIHGLFLWVMLTSPSLHSFFSSELYR